MPSDIKRCYNLAYSSIMAMSEYVTGSLFWELFSATQWKWYSHIIKTDLNVTHTVEPSLPWSTSSKYSINYLFREAMHACSLVIDTWASTNTPDLQSGVRKKSYVYATIAWTLILTSLTVAPTSPPRPHVGYVGQCGMPHVHHIVKLVEGKSVVGWKDHLSQTRSRISNNANRERYRESTDFNAVKTTGSISSNRNL